MSVLLTSLYSNDVFSSIQNLNCKVLCLKVKPCIIILGEVVRTGSRGSKAPLNPTDRWKDRFHRNLPFSEDFSIYVTRPTFELLRRGDEKGQHAFREIRKCLQNLYHPEHENYTDLHWKGIPVGTNYSVSYHNPAQGQIKSVIFSGPYNVDSEMSKCKSAILIHASTEIKPESGRDFNLKEKFSIEPKYVLDGENNIEYQRTLETLLDKDDYRTLEHIAWDLGAARLLPTEYMIGENEANFRRILLQQFNEIRLIDDVTKVNFEQVLTINRFRFEDSPMMNISGRPGTGKSTIQHILVCESLLQVGMNRGKRKILYLATTQTLLDEAKEEIKSILELVYMRTQREANSDIANIDFITEESLYLVNPGNFEKINSKNIQTVLGKINQDISIPKTEKSRWDFWFNNPDLLARILNNFVYGVFGSSERFCKWIPETGNDEEIQDLFDEAINLHKPFQKSVADIRPIYFWNPFSNCSSKSKACDRIRSLKSLLSVSGGLVDYLHDFESNNDGLWNASGLIYSTANYLSNAGKGNDDLSKEWKTALHSGYDCIFIDESQDFSTYILSVLLEYFSNRGETNATNRPPFIFIAAGDEYQTIRGSLFQGKMLHINNLYQDWKESLILQSKDANWTLADGLNNPQKKDLRANYRNFDTAVEVVNHIVTKMSDIGQKAMPNMKRAIKLNRADVERRGYLASSPNDEERRDQDSEVNWALVLEQLAKQVNDYTGKNESVVKVALILPCQKITSKEIVMQHLNSIKNWPNEDIQQSVSKIIGKIGNLYDDKDGISEWVTILSEIGIYDIESIKGLTVPVVVTFYKESGTNKQPWTEMQELSYILVAVSRPQFGLFVITDTIEEYQNITQQKNPHKNTIPEDGLNSNEGFRSFLENSTIPQTPISKLLLQALNSAYSPRKWRRLQNDIINFAPKTYDFIEALKKIFMTIRRPIELDTLFDVSQDFFDTLFENIRDTEIRTQIELYLNGNFITEQNNKADNISTLKLFVNLNILSRLSYDGDDDFELFDKIVDDTRKLWIGWNNLPPEMQNRGFARTTLSSTRSCFTWLNLLFGNFNEEQEANRIMTNIQSMITQMKHSSTDSRDVPANGKLTKLAYPFGHSLPRIKISPWHFPKPIDAEYTQPWMIEDSYWSLSAKLIINIIRSFERGTNSDLSSKFIEEINPRMKWIIRVMEREPEEIVNSVIECSELDESIINWLMRLLIPSDDSEILIVKQLLEVVPDMIVSNHEFAAIVKSWLLGLEDVDNIVTALDLIVRLDPVFDKNLLAILDVVPVIKKWQQKYLLSSNKIATIPDTISKILNHIYPEIQPGRTINELNRIIELDGSANSDEEFVRGITQEIDRDGNNRIEMFSGNDSNNDAIEWERNFSSGRRMLDIILQSTINSERMTAYFNEFYLSKGNDVEGALEVTEKDIRFALKTTNWLLLNLPPKSNIHTKLHQSCKSVNQDALNKITSTIAYGNKSTNHIFNSLNSDRAQLGHFLGEWYDRDPSIWNWRNSGHNFWNLDIGYVNDFAELRAASRFSSNSPFNPQLYINDDTLTAYILAHKILNDEGFEDSDFEVVSTHFLKGGASDRAIESIILNFALNTKKKSMIKDLIKVFADSLLTQPAIYTSHLNNLNTSVDRGKPAVLPRWGDAIKEPSEYIPKLITEDILKRATIPEHVERSFQELEFAKDRNLTNYTIEIEPDSEEVQPWLKENMENDLHKYFSCMKNFHENMRLSKLLKEGCKGINSVEDAIELVKEIKASKITIQTYRQDRKPFTNAEFPILMYVDTKYNFRLMRHTAETEVDFSAKKFAKHFKLLEQLINAVSGSNEESFVQKVKSILSEHYGNRSLIRITKKDENSATADQIIDKPLSVVKLEEDPAKILESIRATKDEKTRAAFAEAILNPSKKKKKEVGIDFKKFLEYMNKFGDEEE